MESEQRVLRIGDAGEWHFTNGDWVDGDGGLLSVPEAAMQSDGYGMQGHHYAFHRGPCYRDVRVRFEFMLRGHSDVGVVLRAADESHFYLLHFPCCGQAYRAQHFWAAFSKMDDSGYLKCIKLEMVHRVPSNIGYWVPAELSLTGDRISVRVAEHGYFEARDDTYAGPGHVGVYLNSYYESGTEIRNVVVEGTPVSGSPWRDDVRQPTNWFYPAPTSEEVRQATRSLVRFPDGELLLSFSERPKGEPDQSQNPQPKMRFTRSADGGRTWSDPDEGVEGPLHLTPAGRLIRLFRDQDEWVISESQDRGRTWSSPSGAGIGPVPPNLETLHAGPQPFLNLADGAMVLPLYGRHGPKVPDLEMYNWGSWHWKAFACRSTDDGRTWSAPVNIDNSARHPDDPMCNNLDLTETCAAQMSDGRIMALVRPMYSPWMWETWSDDGGATWGPCVRGPFPGYATPNMVRTSSGAVLVAHRLPTMSIHCSLDEGHTWDQGTMIDNAVWCMGSMCEVEPDVVLYCYMDTFERQMRAQLMRVTSAGLEPVRLR